MRERARAKERKQYDTTLRLSLTHTHIETDTDTQEIHFACCGRVLFHYNIWNRKEATAAAKTRTKVRLPIHLSNSKLIRVQYIHNKHI